MIALVCLFLSSTTLAVQPDEILKDPALESRARALSAELRCLVCQNQSIDESDAPLARDLRILLRERLAAGDSDARTMDFVVDRYGEYVLLKPRLTAKTALLWGGPFLIVAVTLGFFLLRRRRTDKGLEAALTPEERAALAQITKSPQV